MDDIHGTNKSVNEDLDTSSISNEADVPVFTTSLGGITVNEILPAPTTAAGDEFVELFNTTGAPIDISGWSLQDEGIGTWAGPFPAGTVIPAGGFLEVPNPGGSGIINNGGDAVYLVDDMGNFVTFTFNGFTPDPTDASLTLGGTNMGTESLGSELPGLSIQRDPDGSMTFANDQPATPGATNTCFLAHTRILTAKGYKEIETLKVGDQLRTNDGELKPVKWVSIQTINIDQSVNPSRRNPVCFKKGSLGHNLPKRDLYTSPDHAMFVDGLLINAGALVNGVNIISTVPTDEFNYYHIELDAHELIIAEGCPTESYLPQKELRADYDNAAEFNEIYPNGNKLMLWPMPYARISSAFKVPTAIQNSIVERSKTNKLNRA